MRNIARDIEDRWKSVLTVSLLLVALGCSYKGADKMDSNGKELMPCPGTPNCVSSLSVDESFRVKPFSTGTDARASWQRLHDVVSGMKRSKVVAFDDRYMHVEFRSLVFRFVDDVEFLLDAERGEIHVRSASRVGNSDLGVNRRRVEEIRNLFGEE